MNAIREQRLYIGGEWVDGESSVAVVDRWTQAQIGAVQRAGRTQATAAVDAAEAALGAGLPVSERVRLLIAVARIIERDREQFAQSITAEIGKPITASRLEVARAISTFTLAGEEASRLPVEAVSMDATAAGEGMIGFTLAQPSGIVAAITPFNFPLNLVAHKLGPALAAGCPVLFKPSDRTQLTAGRLVDAFIEAGVPRGFLNLVTGDAAEIVSTWQEDDRVAVVTFTGSSAVGWALKAAAPHKRHVLELGSNTAMVVADDADLERAATDTVTAALSNSGQACVSLQRVYVHESVADAYLARVAELFAGVSSGDPRNDSTLVGPLATDRDVERLQSWIAEAVEGGARVIEGGTAEGGVLAPTVLADVSISDRIVREEVFGPVVSVMAVSDLDEATRLVNDSRYGLNTALYTNRLDAALDYARQAEAGAVLINIPPSFRSDSMPYGGVKDSGQGREGVRYAIAELVEQKLVVLKA
jgi:acyl-CoA reductase-like NAD-dependent aldehyde dehydrogenase